MCLANYVYGFDDATPCELKIGVTNMPFDFFFHLRGHNITFIVTMIFNSMLCSISHKFFFRFSLHYTFTILPDIATSNR
jgi:hypothetical protein